MQKIVIIFCLAIFCSCRKENRKWITGTVTQSKGCDPNTWLVKLDNPNPSIASFLCNPEQASASSWLLDCGNSVVILNLPSTLTEPGTQIKFSEWENRGLLCFSSTLSPHHIEVSDISAK